jgi:hypothetical protein
MPSLLKRLSEKNLRKRAQSSDSNSFSDELKTPPRSISEPVPPLPPPKSPQSDRSFRNMTPPSSMRTPDRPSTPSPRPKGVQFGAQSDANSRAYALPPSLPPANGYGAPDDLSKELAAAWDVANKDQTVSKTDKFLQKMGSSLPCVLISRL